MAWHSSVDLIPNRSSASLCYLTAGSFTDRRTTVVDLLVDPVLAQREQSLIDLPP